MSRRIVFLDAWAWIALVVADDPHHQLAVRLMAELRTAGAHRVSSNFVLAEALTRLRYSISHRAAVVLADAVDGMIETATLEVVVVDQPLWDDAMRWFRHYSDQRFSFVDCTSFAIMHDRAIQEALTSDAHFATAGFTPLAA